MLETIITSSVLIAVLTLLRYLFKEKINLRLQYALWLLVAVRLLMPISIFESSLSVLNIVDIGRQTEQLESPATWTQSNSSQHTGVNISESMIGLTDNAGTYRYTVQDEMAHSDISPHEKVLLSNILYTLWLIGAIAVGLWFILQNIWFYMRLRKTRETAKISNSQLQVYLSRHVKSPCLFGFRPAIYIHPDSLTDDEVLKYILSHEETHYRHGDHLWSYLRCVCLALHWFNPLVWWAAVLSRRDCEIACDESTLIRIGDEHRKAYGNTLINMIERRAKPSDLLLGATTMTSGKSGIKERITMIAKKPKMAISTLVVVLLVTAVAIGCTFTGAKIEESDIVPLTAEEVERFNETFEPLLSDEQGNSSLNPLSHFLTSYYDRSEDINLSEFLRYFPPEEDVADEAEFKALKAAENWPFGAAATLDSMPVSIHRFPADIVNEALKKRMGITLDDLSGVGVEDLIYLKEYDAYYNFTSDFAAGTFTCTRGESQGDIIRLYSETAVLTLKKQGDGFLFVSHQRAVGRNDKIAVESVVKLKMKEFDPSEYTSSTNLAEARQKVSFSIFIPTVIPAELVAENLTIDEGSPNFVRIEYRSKDGSVGLNVVNGPAGSGLAADPRKKGKTINIRSDIEGHYLINQPEFGGPILWWEEAGSYVALSGPELSKIDLTKIADSMSLTTGKSSWTPLTEADVTRDGIKETVYLDKSQMDITFDVTLRVLDSSGNEIWSESANSAHAGWDSLFLCRLDGREYLLRYNPRMGQGYSTYEYTLFTLEGGKEKVYKTNTLEFDLNGTKELDAPKMIAFAEEVNELLGKSILLMSTEGGAYSFGPASTTPFIERYSWLDMFTEFFSSGDDLKTRLEKYSEYAISNHG